MIVKKADHRERANCDQLGISLNQIGQALDQYLTFEHPDALANVDGWRQQLATPLPQQGVGLEATLETLASVVIPHGSSIPRPGSTAFITTGAANIALLANLAGNVASPQRAGLTAFHFLEELSLDWLAEMLGLDGMKGVYSSGGSVANLVALGAARQSSFEKVGVDPAMTGVDRPVRVYASEASHHTIQRALAVLGCGRDALCLIATDKEGRMLPQALEKQIAQDHRNGPLKMAVVANAGSTSRGVVDPLYLLGSIARREGIWFHVDGAYGLPGILDPEKQHLYNGLELADSAIVDPHKWLGAQIGIGATFVRDRNLLHRAFTQGESDYLEGSTTPDTACHSIDSLGTPYFDFGVELSAPARGVVVWAILNEVGVEGLRARICRHNAMARHIADRAEQHPDLELLQEPTLSICCFRYVDNRVRDIDALNRAIHRQLIHNNVNMPSTATINGQLAIRPCFVGARTSWAYADSLVDEVLHIGKETAERMARLPPKSLGSPS